MVIVAQNLFSWQEVSAKSDLDRLKAVIKVLPNEELMKVSEAERGKGRDDYPIRAVWNSILAGVAYQHPSIESLRRELLRNGELRYLCGFDPIARSSYAWKRKYKRRTAVERINSRLDVSFGFERHYIKGLAKMEVRVGLAMIVMLGLAKASIVAGQKEKMRSLVVTRSARDSIVLETAA